MPKYKYKTGVLGGTFDNLHKGHKFFIKKAFEKSENVIIGLTTERFVNLRKPNQKIQNYKTRKTNLEKFLKDENLILRSKIIPINNSYGVTLEKNGIDALFITEDTHSTALLINVKRKELGLQELKLEIVSLINDDKSKKISSSKIREGAINDFGNYYETFFKTKNNLILKSEFREDFKKPIGQIIKNIDKKLFEDKFIIAIGDVAVAKLVETGIFPNISIFDLITKREKVSDEVLKFLPKEHIVLKNKPGTINSKTALKLHELNQNSLKTGKTTSIKILGEEDLLTIPAILFAPIGSLIFYGLRNVGGVLVKVTLGKKREIEENFLSKFH